MSDNTVFLLAGIGWLLGLLTYGALLIGMDWLKERPRKRR